MKRLARIPVGLTVTALMAFGGRALDAQTNGTWRVSPEPNRNSRRAVEAPPSQPQVVVVPSQFGGGNSVFRRQPIAFFTIPAILLSDGTVLANFGMGYEPVRRSCGGGVVVSSNAFVVGANGRVLSRPPTYTQPVPNQATASQQLLPSNQSRFPILTAASQSACFSSDGAGRFFVITQ